jgi:hypothetical protein
VVFLKLPDFNASRTEALINAFFQNVSGFIKKAALPSPKPTLGLRFIQRVKCSKNLLTMQAIF